MLPARPVACAMPRRRTKLLTVSRLERSAWPTVGLWSFDSALHDCGACTVKSGRRVMCWNMIPSVVSLGDVDFAGT